MKKLKTLIHPPEQGTTKEPNSYARSVKFHVDHMESNQLLEKIIELIRNEGLNIISKDDDPNAGHILCTHEESDAVIIITYTSIIFPGSYTVSIENY